MSAPMIDTETLNAVIDAAERTTRRLDSVPHQASVALRWFVEELKRLHPKTHGVELQEGDFR